MRIVVRRMGRIVRLHCCRWGCVIGVMFICQNLMSFHIVFERGSFDQQVVVRRGACPLIIESIVVKEWHTLIN